MLVRYSVLADASGSFGGLVASHARAGQYLRTRVRPTNPRTPAQSLVRTIFANLSITWSTLTEDQREAWRTYAINVPVTNAFGDPFNLTGHQMYIRNNAARLQAGLSRIQDGPTVFSGVPLSAITYEPVQTAGAIFLTINVADPWTTTPGAALLVYVTRQGSGTVRYRRLPYRFFGQPFLGPFTPVPHEIAFNAPTAITANDSNSIFVRSRVVLPDGRISSALDTGPVLILPV